MRKHCLRWILITAAALLTGCGFHLRGEMPLAQPLHSLYIQSIDPYGTLVHNLEQSLKMSNVKLADKPGNAQTILIIARDDTSQKLLSVGATQQTRQYELAASVTFEVTDAHNRSLVPQQTLTEKRAITVQSNQILGSSNEANLYYQQMRRSLANAIMYRLSSHEVTAIINKAFQAEKPSSATTRQPINKRSA